MPDAFAGRGGLWLALDASTYSGTVAVFRDTQLLAAGATAMRGAEEERLLPAVVDMLGEACVAPRALSAIVCGAGPGSFTSLRIAASIAKGLAHAGRVPLYATPSLALLAASLGGETGRLIVSADALRGDVYAAAVTVDGTQVTAHRSLGVVRTETLGALAAEHQARLVTPDASRAPDARYAGALLALLDHAGPVDLDGWEPDYGRKAEAQVKWEAAHGRSLPGDGSEARRSA